MLDLFTQRNAVIINTILAVSGAILFTIYLATRRYAYNPKGCRRLGLPAHKSNLADEYDTRYIHGVSETSADEGGRPAWRVKALFTYPIKSCNGVELDAGDIVPTGFRFDRLFCFAEEDSSGPEGREKIWVAKTLRNRGFNRLALVRPEIWVPDPKIAGYSSDLKDVRSNGVMVVYYPRVGLNALHDAFIRAGTCLGLIQKENSFAVPLYPPESPEPGSFPLVPVKIWKDIPLAYDYGSFISPSFHRFLNASQTGESFRPKRLTLLRTSSAHTRDIYRNAPRKETLGFQPTTGFADAYPLHILSLSSVRDVNSHCANDIPQLSIRRFRANIIVQGPEKFEEDSWKVIRFTSFPPSAAQTGNGRPDENKNGGLIVHTACRTIRCRLPNVHPDTGFRHPSEPDRSLKAYRRIDEGDLTNACLGMQGVPAVTEGTICVGDGIEVLERGQHRYIKMLAPGEVVEGV